MSKVEEEAYDITDTESMAKPDTDQDDQVAEEWQLAQESPPSRTVSERRDDNTNRQQATTPKNRVYRKAALRCIDKLKEM
ncbi:unnamed protein product [Parnassius mnemosyne]|uniref:Uncharacterized protein n=1 Tax=Parnassius mnemosyne TaxID=213953 RepID=A0AAV1L6I6_9NEOP